MNKEFVPIEISYNLFTPQSFKIYAFFKKNSNPTTQFLFLFIPPPQQLFFNVLKNDKLVSVEEVVPP